MLYKLAKLSQIQLKRFASTAVAETHVVSATAMAALDQALVS